MVSERVPALHVFGALVFLAGTYAILLSSPERVEQLAGRERLVEAMGAVFLLAASVGCLLAFWHLRRAGLSVLGRRRFFYLLLGIFFFIAFGEELSWGQHLFGFEAPETFRRHNVQEEFNLHNLRGLDSYTTEGEKKTGLGFLLNSNRLFDYFMLLVFLVLPLVGSSHKQTRVRLERLGVPLLPLVVGGILVTNLLATATAELFVVRGVDMIHLAVSEIRETNYALLCLLATSHWLSQAKTLASR